PLTIDREKGRAAHLLSWTRDRIFGLFLPRQAGRRVLGKQARRTPRRNQTSIRRKSRAGGLSVPPFRVGGSAPLRHHRRRIRCKRTDRLEHATAATLRSGSADLFRKTCSEPPRRSH